jgi:hypothetical protein
MLSVLGTRSINGSRNNSGAGSARPDQVIFADIGHYLYGSEFV